VEIEQVPSLFHKKNWLVRQPSSDVWQWVLLIGRNFKSGDWRSEGFYEWDSLDGANARGIALSTTKTNRHPRQEGLF
jgi:hypothetical protein